MFAIGVVLQADGLFPFVCLVFQAVVFRGDRRRQQRQQQDGDASVLKHQVRHTHSHTHKQTIIMLCVVNEWVQTRPVQLTCSAPALTMLTHLKCCWSSSSSSVVSSSYSAP